MSKTDRELPLYQSHKKVGALRIEDIAVRVDGSALIVPAEKWYATFEVDKEYMMKHCPTRGGYYVLYEDGYKSYSPAEAFKAGYTLIE